MRLVTFDPFRTLGIPGVRYIKPALLMRHLDEVEAADWLLFPEYADVQLLVHGMGKRIFPSLASYSLGFDKIEMTRAFQARFAAHLPFTLILPNTGEHSAQVCDWLPFPFVAKLPRASRGSGVFLIENAADWRDYCARSPMLYVQERLPIDRDLRVVWIGERIVHAYWRVAAPGSFHNNVAQGGRIDLQQVPTEALDLVGRMARTLDIDHAGFDIAMVEGKPLVFEFNRLFGLDGLNAVGISTAGPILAYLQAGGRRSRVFQPPSVVAPADSLIVAGPVA